MTEKDARKVIALDKRFEMFLRKNHLIKEYIEAFKVAGNYPRDTDPSYKYIDRTLWWQVTPQGHEFWDKQHDLCKEFYLELKNEI